MPDEVQLPDRCIFRNELQLTRISLPDLQSPQRDMWEWTIFPDARKITLPSGPQLINLSELGPHPSDIIIISGNDVANVRRVLELNQNNFKGRIKLCVIYGATPGDRVKVIEAGCDDVFDPAIMPAEEAVARVRAHWRRSRVTIHNSVLEGTRADRLALILEDKHVSPREQAVLACLLENPGETVNYDTFLERISTERGAPSLSVLKVVICLLRRKLKQHVSIKAISKRGYRLEIFSPFHSES